MVDGNRHRDPLTWLVGTLSTGEACVSGFFLISGYLIAKSMVGISSVPIYLERRIFRIYPAFVVSSLLCTYLLGPIVSANVLPIWQALPHILILETITNYPGAFPGMQHYPTLNGPLWTISYEFRCYLLVVLLWLIGSLSRPAHIALLTLLLLAASVVAGFLGDSAVPDGSTAHTLWNIIGEPRQSLGLTATFMVGVTIFVYRDRILSHLDSKTATLALLVGGILLPLSQPFANAIFAVSFAPFLFWLCFKANLGLAQRVNDKWDISYGVYLYGWPIANLIRWRYASIGPWALAGITLPLACLAGALSWFLVERWFKDIRLLRPQPRAVVSEERVT